MNMILTADQFRALGDPVRMEIILRLSAGEAVSVGILSDGLPVTRQGARKHIQVLADSRVISLRRDGRVVKAALNKEAIVSMREWMNSLEKAWNTRLHRLKSYVENQ